MAKYVHVWNLEFVEMVAVSPQIHQRKTGENVKEERLEMHPLSQYSEELLKKNTVFCKNIEYILYLN